MAKAKINASQVKSVAARGGVRAPVAPVRVQKPDQLKKQAQARAKARAKMLIRVAIFALIILIVGLVVYLVKFHGRMPKDAFYSAVEYAYKDNTIKFKEAFTSDSIELVESGDGNPEDHWMKLMDGITPSTRPKVTKEDQTEKNGIKTATLTVNVDGELRTVYMLNEEGKWKINLNVAINPRMITLPDDIPPEYVENFELTDEPEAWWESDKEESDEKSKKSGFFSKLKSGKLFK